jgi:hypothetical protein
MQVIPDSQVREILRAMDADGNGRVDYSEFLAAALRLGQMERGDWEAWRDHTRWAFSYIIPIASYSLLISNFPSIR